MKATAKLRNYPTSPRKMRLVADLIRGKKVEEALIQLEYSPKHAAEPMQKLLLSAVNNWKQANEGKDESNLIVDTIFVDEGTTLKRLRPAPQGRGYRVRKRSNHITIMVDDPYDNEEVIYDEPPTENVEEVETEEAETVEVVEETKTKKTKSTKK